jgi:hypothetical protein
MMGDGQQKQQTGNTIKYIKTKYYMSSAVCMCMYKHGVICCTLCHYFCQPILIAALSVLFYTINGLNLSTSHVNWTKKITILQNFSLYEDYVYIMEYRIWFMKEHIINGRHILCCRPVKKTRNFYWVSVTFSQLVLFNNLKKLSALLK